MSEKVITVNMSDGERAEILKKATISPPEIGYSADIDFELLQKSNWKDIKKPLIDKLSEMGFLRKYETKNVDVDFSFTGGGLRKSVNSQIFEYGGNLADFAKVVMNLQALLDSAVLIEIHTDKAVGTPKENARLQQTYVLLSAFRKEGFITPVQFEIKQYIDDDNRLYLAVALTKIEVNVVSDTAHPIGERTRLLPTSVISIPYIFSKINPKDKNFFKYIPDVFLDKSQLIAKENAFEREAKKYERGTKTMKRPSNWEELLDAAKHRPDVVGAFAQIGIQLKPTGSGGRRYQTTTDSGREGDLSSLVFRQEDDGSWSIFDNKQRTGKTRIDPIEGLRFFGGVSFDDAVYMLSGGRPDVPAAKPVIPSAPLPKERKPFSPPPTYKEKTKNVIAYMTQERKLPYSLVKALIDNGKIYAGSWSPEDNPDYKVTKCVFKITDENGNFVGADSLTPRSDYKGHKGKYMSEGSDENYAWCFSWGNIEEITKDTRLYFCEAPVDAMSLCALSGMEGVYISLSGVKDVTFRSMAEKLGGTPVICVDKDDGGDRFANRNPQYERMLPTHGKDWNDELKYYVENKLSFALSEPKQEEKKIQKETLTIRDTNSSLLDIQEDFSMNSISRSAEKVNPSDKKILKDENPTPQTEQNMAKKQEKKKAAPEAADGKTIVVNLFAGPCAGKTTTAYEICAELKKRGVNVEYVAEYAKDLVYAEKFDLLANQEHVTDTQYERLNALRDKVDVIVTDSPVLLGQVYGKGKITPEYAAKIKEYHDSFDSFNLFIERGQGYQQEGRIQTLPEAIAKDNEIKEMLKANAVYYGTYRHDTVGRLVANIQKHLRNRQPKAEDKSPKKDNAPQTEGTEENYLAETTDGRIVAVVNEDILKDIYKGTWDRETIELAQKAAKKALSNFKDGIYVNDVNVKVNRDTRREYTRSNYSETLSKKDPESFLDKMRVASALDKVIYASVDWASDGGLNKERADKFVNFHRGKTLILAKDRAYEAKVLLGETKNGDFILYDLLQITPTTLALKKEIEKEIPTTVTPNKSFDDVQEDFSMNSISPSPQNVNPSDKKILKDENPTPQTEQNMAKKQEKKKTENEAAEKKPRKMSEAEAKQNALKEDLKGKVTAAVEKYRSDPTALAEYLSFSARFNNYSPKNIRLIWVQDPDARFVAAASYFKAGMPDANGEPTTKENISIKKGEKAMRIWKPYEIIYVEVPQEDGKAKLQILAHLPENVRKKAKEENWKTRKSVKFQLVPVFDISQTTASPEVYPKYFGFGGNTYRDAEAQFRAVKNYAENTLNCPVTVEDLGSRKTSVRGFFVPDDNRIVISDMLSGDAKLSTLIHEVGHAELHGDNAENAKKSEAQIELEADMYSLMIESRLGIEPTDAHCRHLGTHYEMYLKEVEAKLPEGETLDLNSDMEVLENVTKRYTERSALIDEYLSRQTSIDAQMAALDRGGESQTSKQSQTSVESDKPKSVADSTPGFGAKL